MEQTTVNVIDQETLEVVKTTTQTQTISKGDLERRISELQGIISTYQAELSEKQALLGEFNGN